MQPAVTETSAPTNTPAVKVTVAKTVSVAPGKTTTVKYTSNATVKAQAATRL